MSRNSLQALADLVAALSEPGAPPPPAVEETLALSMWLTERGDALLAAGDLVDGERAEAAAQELAETLGPVRTLPEPGLAAAPAPTVAALTPEYQSLFASCVTAPAHVAEIRAITARLISGRLRYAAVEAQTQVPWWFIALIHALEGRSSFFAHLHNGDPLKAPTVHVPAHRPPNWQPPGTWETSAVDALTIEHFVGKTPWDLPHALYRLEAYNGFGSRRHQIHTPYLWSFSQHYTAGKFVADRVYDPAAVSKQAGAAVLLKSLTTGGVVHF